MMSEQTFNSIDQIRLEARLMAIENIFAGLFADVSRRHGVTFNQFCASAEETHQQLRQQLIGQRADNVISDIVAAEVEQAFAALLQKVAHYARIGSQGNTRQQNWTISALKKRWHGLWLRSELAISSPSRRKT